jgi:tetratricopeptide (TPR) repeat protein
MTNVRAWLVIVLAIVACRDDRVAEVRAAIVAPADAEPSTASYDDLVGRLDRAIAAREREASSHASWRREAAVANAWLARADLTGSYDDYEKVDDRLRRAFALARPGSGPHLLRARFLLRMHRIDDARVDLATIGTYAELDPATAQAREALLADIAMSEGRFADALASYESLAARDRSSTNLARLAHHAAKTGALERADALYAEALGLAHEPQTAAWLELQRGLLDLDADRLDDAAAHYRCAAGRLSGWWLVDEHLAEIDARQGRSGLAIAAYRDLVARTDNPEFMDALSDLLRTDAPAEASAWQARARAAYEHRLAVFPAATYGHALEHFLRDPSATHRALELARANQRVRPGPDAEALRARAEVSAGARSPVAPRGDAAPMID